MNGTIKFVNPRKMYGFLTRDTDFQDVYFCLANCIGRVSKDDRVSFEVIQGKKGEEAVSVKKID